jgi:hypothetical protein
MRSRPVLNAAWIAAATAGSVAAAVTAVGSPRLTSSAWLGPDSAPVPRRPSSSSVSSDIRLWVFASSPFTTDTEIGRPLNRPLNLPTASRKYFVGTAATASSAPAAASAGDAVHPIDSGSRTPGRYRLFSLERTTVSM